MVSQSSMAWRGRLDEIGRAIAKNITMATRRAGDDLQYELKKQTIQGGLGNGIANAWRMKMYPRSGVSPQAAAQVYSRAPIIHSAFNDGATIRTKNGERFLAIPTDNVPRGPRGKRLTPMEVEDWLNGDLDFIKFRSGRPGGVLVAKNKLARTKSGKRWRRVSGKSRSSAPAQSLVIMFYLVPTATLKKRLDIQGAEMKILQSYASDLEKTIGRE